MTMFIKIESGSPVGHPVTEENLKAIYPNHTFPAIYSLEFVASLGFGIYEFTRIPEIEYPEISEEIAPRLGENGIYYQTWNIRLMNDTEKEKATKERAEKVIRERTLYLYQSDWTQIPDVQITEEKKQAFLVYRQALRDIPLQAGFPWNVTWPVLPE